MAFQAVINAVEIDVIYTYNGIGVQNVFYAHAPAGYVLLDLQQLAGTIDGVVGGGWLTEQPTEAVYVRTEVRGLTVENDLAASDGTSTGPGTNAGVALPNNVTLSIKKESGLTGRSARGRTYWIGIPRTETTVGDENILTNVYVTAVVANVELIRTGINGLATWNAVLVSRFTGGAERTVGKTFPWISSVAIDQRVDTQRNRLS